MKKKQIDIRNARSHNLKSINLQLNKNELIVFTGVSGSGKSSLAFDTIYVEGQRRYIESLSHYSKRHLETLGKPDVDHISGLSPTISIEQKTISNNPRSTVGTITGIYDFLRVLYARLATPYCPISNEPVLPQSKESILEQAKLFEKGNKIIVLSPFARSKKGTFQLELQKLLKQGFARVRIDNKICEINEDITIEKNKKHDVDIVIDRLVIDKKYFNRLDDAIIRALEVGEGNCIILDVTKNKEFLFSVHFFSKKSRRSYPPLEPRNFSFNSPSGMCKTCQGLGRISNENSQNSDDLSLVCTKCEGSRLAPYPSAAKLNGKTIFELTSMTISETLELFNNIKLTKRENIIAKDIIDEIKVRIQFLLDVGLHYITLNRSSTTLSGGEAQRVRLASQIGCGLTNVTYVLDEPSIGLHPVDNEKLLLSLQNLRDKGNTVIVVEHDEDTIKTSDYIVDFGPNAGEHGGNIVFNGHFNDILKDKASLTGAYLRREKEIPIPKTRRKLSKQFLKICNATHNNLKNVNFKIPLGRLTIVTGVSGSGKSSLVTDTLYPALANQLYKAKHNVGNHKKLSGIEHIDKVIDIDQTPIGKTPRSNPATYTKLFDHIRDFFSQLPESRARGYTKGRFSFNVALGSCSNCKGSGVEKVDMDFLENAYRECPLCHGRRFDDETLSIYYKNKNIYDILEMSVDEAMHIFKNIPFIKRKLKTLQDVGLGYIKIGQPSTTLSGGEAQRVKLAKELAKPSTGKTIYILDEPTTGLHFHDVKHLLNILSELVERGNTVLIIEHNIDVIKSADWIIDLGPGGGPNGGTIIATGTPESIAKIKSHTGHALKKAINNKSIKRQKAKKTKEGSNITVKGAKQHNLQNIDVEIPKNKITIFTGPSGSGKTSLAIDTIYAEGQRRYTDSLSTYARQFIRQRPKAKVKQVNNLPPAIAIEQKSHAGNPRSTVGTLTEIYDYLRIIYAHIGIPHCPETGEEIKAISKEFVVEKTMTKPTNSSIQVLAPINYNNIYHALNSFKQQGFLRIRLNGKIYRLDEKIPINPEKDNELLLIIDRLKIRPSIKSRLFEAVECAQKISGNKVVIMHNGKDQIFSLSFCVESTGKIYPEITPQIFAFNTPKGMCTYCRGLGYIENYSQNKKVCPSCSGSKLNPLARNVTIKGLSINKLCQMPIDEILSFIKQIKLNKTNLKILSEVYNQLVNRLSFLCEVGLNYIALDRSAPTLSGGEMQRIRLAKQLGSELTGVLYVLDEPSIGLHPHDNDKLNRSLKKLKNLGNTILMVEHDPLTLQHADYIYDFGPGAGHTGGKVCAKGTIAQVKKDKNSLTGQYLSGKKYIPVPSKTRKYNNGFLSVKNASVNNLKNISTNFPVETLCCITGVSGSGKSSLMHDVLYPALENVSFGVLSTLDKAFVKKAIISGLSHFDRVINLDQNPIGETMRSDVGTYSDLSSSIRRFYADLSQAYDLGLTPGHFSYNTDYGMCKACRGYGQQWIDLLFMPTAKVMCDYCKGKKLNNTSLSIKYNGRSFGDLFNCTIDEIRSLFKGQKAIVRRCDKLIDVGLGYLKFGQAVETLSGGEAQRLRLAKELKTASRKKTIYLFDEPTIGLHDNDIEKLLKIFHDLVDNGNTIIVIEHNLDIIKNADFILDLGPGPGIKGGHIVASGTPSQIAKTPNSLTGRYLKT